jgi:hypothetical protein
MTSDADTPARPKGGSRALRFLFLCFLIVLLPILVLLIWHISWRASNNAAIRRLEAAARQRGEPLTLAQLATNSPALPDKDNGALLLMALWEKDDPVFWQAFRNGERPLPEGPRGRLFDPTLPYLGGKVRPVVRGEPLEAASRQAAEAWLAAEAPHLQAAREALQMPYCRFPINYSEGFTARLPHLSALKREAQFFLLEAAVCTDRNEPDKALTALENVARAGHPLADEPFLISQLVRLACLGLSLNGAERLLSRQVLTPAQLAQLTRLLDSLQTTGAVRRSYIGERATAVNIFALPAKAQAQAMAEVGTSGSDESQAQQTGMRAGMGLMTAVGLAGADHRLMLETFDKVLQLAEDDSAAALLETEHAFDQAAVQARRFPPKIFSGMLLPALERGRTKFAAVEARRRAGLAAVAIERYRLAHQGNLPESLPQLVPALLPVLPTDPFDDQPLRYKQLPKGYVVYSVGANRRDDGGQERAQKGPAARDYDETFIVER